MENGVERRLKEKRFHGGEIEMKKESMVIKE